MRFLHWHWRTVVVGLVVASLAYPAAAAPADYAIQQGRFFMQTGGPSGERGYAVTNRDGVRFWDAFQQLGGVQAVGYPVSGRFLHDGFVTQVMQKAVFQWRPESGSVSFVNVFDDLSRADKNDWLLSVRSTPRPLPPDFDAGKDWLAVVRDRTALLNARPAIRARYFAIADPLLRYGLPTSRLEDMGNHYALRLQRAVIQEWKVDVPWAKAGETTVANGGDIMKEAGLVPADAVDPESAPGVPDPDTAPLTVSSTGDARLLPDLTTVRRTPSTGGAELARVFRNAQVEIAGPVVDGPGGSWLAVRVWNALTGWLPASALTSDPYPDKDTARGSGYRRAIQGAPAPAIPLQVDAAAQTIAPVELRATPGGPTIAALPAALPARLVGYGRETGRTWLQIRVGEQVGWVSPTSVAITTRDPALLVAGRSPGGVVAGKGMWATYDLLDRASPEAIVETARANGLTHIYLQVGRSNLGFYGARGLDQLLPAAHAAGIAVIGWVYPFLKDTISDVYMTASVVLYTTPDGQRVDGLAADIEENTGADEVHAYGQLVRALVGDDLPMIVATFPPEMAQGRTYPYAVVAQTWNVIAPMDYYRAAGRPGTPDEAYGYVARSIQLIRERAGRAVLVAPIGQAYAKGWPNEIGPPNPSGDETRAMLRAARDSTAVGISFFEWSHSTAAQWREIGAFRW